jgi:hypothetical protein
MTQDPRPPAHIEAYVRILGVDGAIEFLLTFGGAELYLATSPKGRSRLAKQVGIEKATALAEASEHLPRRVPTAKPWIAQVWRHRGRSVADIARTLHVSDVAVRGWVRKQVETDDRQMRLL